MIRWCAYCQTLLGEAPPYTDYAITHGICPVCDARLMRDEHLVAIHAQRIAFFRELFAAARQGDAATSRAYVERGLELGIGLAELAVGVLQPLLAEVGAHWEKGEISAAMEHRVTAWCETFLAALPPPPPLEEGARIELLGLMAPGNRHTVGLRLAEYVLRTQGVHCEAFFPDLPLDEIITLVRDAAPAWIGFSCAQPHMVEAVLSMVPVLRDSGFEGSVMLSGQAVRREPHRWRSSGVTICLTLDEAVAVIYDGGVG